MSEPMEGPEWDNRFTCPVCGGGRWHVFGRGYVCRDESCAAAPDDRWDAGWAKAMAGGEQPDFASIEKWLKERGIAIPPNTEDN